MALNENVNKLEIALDNLLKNQTFDITLNQAFRILRSITTIEQELTNIDNVIEERK